MQQIRLHAQDGDSVLATPEFTYQLKDKSVPHIGWWVWQSKESFYRFIVTHNPAAIVGGMTVNTLGQLNWLLGKETKKYLKSDYDFSQIGTYFLWIRYDRINH